MIFYSPLANYAGSVSFCIQVIKGRFVMMNSIANWFETFKAKF